MSRVRQIRDARAWEHTRADRERMSVGLPPDGSAVELREELDAEYARDEEMSKRLEAEEGKLCES